MFNFLIHNFHLKIFAVVFAIFLWVFVINQGFRVDFLEKEIPIEVYNLSDDLTVVSDLGKVKLKIRAPKTFWQQSPEDLEAYVDLKNFEKGEYMVEVKVSSENPKVQILEKKPAKVKVVIETISYLNKKVTCEFSGSLAEGFTHKEPILSQEEVQIFGAKSILDKINKVIAKIEFNGEEAEIKQSSVLEAQDLEGNVITNVKIDPEVIDVTVPVQKEKDIKTVGVKVKTRGNPAFGFQLEKVEVEPALVSIYGNPEILKMLDFIETQEINIDGLTTSKEEKVNLILSSGITCEPKEVLVRIFVSSQNVISAFEAQINFINLNKKFEVKSYTPSVVMLTLEGSLASIDALRADPKIVNLDLARKGTGTYKLEISASDIHLPKEINLRSIDTKEVKVVIEEK